MNGANFIFNTEHVMINHNNIHQLHRNPSLFIRVIVYTDGQTTPVYKHCSTMLESIILTQLISKVITRMEIFQLSEKKLHPGNRT